jgi:diguanylate cyclase (GGDEF)-like protein
LNPVKTIIPPLLISLAAIIAYWFAGQLPPVVQEVIPMLPFVLLAALALLALFYNQSGLFYAAGLGVLADALLAWEPPLAEPQLWLFWTSGCVALLVVGWLREKGLFSAAGWLTHVLLLALAGVTYAINSRHPELASEWLNPGWLPMAWFTWSPLNLWCVLLWLTVFSGLLWWFIRHNRRRTFDALLVLLMLMVMAHVPAAARDLVLVAGLLSLVFSALQKSWHLAYVDELTGLPGRRALQEKLQRSLGIYALAMVDVDHFKKFNDTYGHDVGDDVLRMIAAKINQVTGGGKAYRYGGEEFTIVFNNHSGKEIKEHLQAVIDAVADTPFVVNRRKKQKPKTVQVTISIGLTDSINKANAEATIKTADQALYTAKKKGRNRLQLKDAS